jgi:hypothetical protein
MRYFLRIFFRVAIFIIIIWASLQSCVWMDIKQNDPYYYKRYNQNKSFDSAYYAEDTISTDTIANYDY